MTPVLELENLEVVYHHVATAVQGVSLRVPPRAIVALLGTNGAGKTTTLRAISGFLGADDAQIVAGRVVFLGATVTGRPPHELARRGLVLVPERDKVFETLTVQENLRALVPGRHGDAGATRAPVTLDQVFNYFPVLAERRRQPSTSLSGGEQQMVAIARALMSNPTLLLCDEISLGLAPIVIRELYARLPSIVAEGSSLVIVEQDVVQALHAATHVYCLQEGRVALAGSAGTLTREAIAAAYFGA